MKKVNKVTVLVDNDSWILPFAEKLCKELDQRGIKAVFACEQQAIVEGDICFMLGCTRIVSSENLAKNTHNLVVHESDLPQGKGFAPMTWQILEGKHQIPICVIEATAEVDAGPIWIKGEISLEGWELCADWRAAQGDKTVSLCIDCIDLFEDISPKPQHGTESFYARRSSTDSELDPNKTIVEQFDLLRVVDNERYPAFFTHRGRKYRLKIYHDE
ncbi:methionyl-tRNA formyltransferase [Motiliproteus coralliicola]|uniref:Methionyl-tRNA formyltransferase n=1 Tax=Motiliproteus coralliicola TaxID=2283196 RepID=A0A369WMY0_9GAMM|nr:formyltransferase family protein [Motiliproteus coralliicola]RDE22573.1 methionyl-tRNA formyltransferase [Motiliproteus coralliicola]